MKWYSKTYATRLSIYIITIVILIFGLMALSYTDLIYYRIKQYTMIQTETRLHNLKDNFSFPLSEIQIMVNNYGWIIERESFQEEENISRLKHLIENNELIFGGAIAYLPEHLIEGVSPSIIYASNDNIEKKVKIKNLDITSYPYTTLEWFKTPVQTKMPYWSNAYFDKGGGNILMCTYSVPLFDENKNLYAILSADISLEALKNQLNLLKPNKKLEVCMLSQTLEYMIEPDNKDLAKEDILSDMITLKHLAAKATNSLNLEYKVQNFYYPELKSYIFYVDIPTTGWSIWCIYPEANMVDGLGVFFYKFFLIFIIGVILLIIIIHVSIKRLTTPLKAFAVSAKQISTGNFEAILPKVNTQDEMRDLSEAMSYMQSSLKLYISQLEEAIESKQKIEQELLIARDIQMDMLPIISPELLAHHHIDFCAELKAAKLVGGDMYGFQFEGNRLHIFIGDVSGKGVPAALFMMNTCSLLRALSTHNRSPESIIRDLNSTVATSNKQNMFLTCFYGVLDLETGNLNYCNAGHNPPVLLTTEGSSSYLEMETNLAVGLLEDYEFVGGQINISDGAKMVLYTDGIIEAENAQGVLYSEERLIKTLEHCGNLNAETILETINKSVANHVLEASQSDDIALLIIGYATPKKQASIAITFKNQLDSLQRLKDFINQTANTFSLTDEFAADIRLAIEEAVVNTIMYGYTEGTQDIISVNVQKNKDTVIITLEDGARAFDPTKVEDPNLENPKAEDPLGGLGIFLIKSLMDKVYYERVEDRNRLTFEKKIISK